MPRPALSARLRGDLTLLLVAAVWGSGFVAQRFGAASMDAFYFNAGRFTLAALVLLGLARFRWRLERRNWKMAGLAGALLFGGSFLQQAGMQTTSVGNAAFITGLYVVIVPLLLFLFWRQRTSWLTLGAVLLAAAGIALLAIQDTLTLNPGDWLELAGAFLWAGHVILIGRLGSGVDGYAFAIAQFLVCAGLNWAAGLALDAPGAGNLLLAWPAVVYSAVLPIAAGFTLQILGQRHAPPVDAAIILSLETVFGSLFGFLLLGEGFTPRQVLGAGMILGAILLCQVKGFNRGDAESTEKKIFDF
jgi:drug/metabolite transporter (DMT)-like permease